MPEINCFMSQSQKMKGLVLSRYRHSDPQIVGWHHKKTNYPKEVPYSGQESIFRLFYNKFPENLVWK